MLETLFSHFVFLLCCLFAGPFIIIAGFQILQGQRVKLPSVGKVVLKTGEQIATVLFDIAEMVAQLVASRLPPKYAHFAVPTALGLKCLCLIFEFWLILKFLQELF